MISLEGFMLYGETVFTNTLPSPCIPYGIHLESMWNENIPWNPHGIALESIWNPCGMKIFHGIHVHSME